jgi:YD repeat-containing protein
MIAQFARPEVSLRTAAIALAGVLLVNSAQASAVYGYDADGRVTTALYDNGLCVVYVYDENGNRTSQTNTASGAPQTPTWGTGSWGCFNWTPTSP